MKKLLAKVMNRQTEQGAVKTSKRGKFAYLMAMAIAAVAALPTAAGAAPIEFTGQTVGVSVGDAVTTGFNFMGMFNEWTLLVAGLILAPVAIAFLLWIVSKAPKQKSKA
jgi:hypothetical protein